MQRTLLRIVATTALTIDHINGREFLGLDVMKATFPAFSILLLQVEAISSTVRAKSHDVILLVGLSGVDIPPPIGAGDRAGAPRKKHIQPGIKKESVRTDNQFFLLDLIHEAPTYYGILSRERMPPAAIRQKFYSLFTTVIHFRQIDNIATQESEGNQLHFALDQTKLYHRTGVRCYVVNPE